MRSQILSTANRLLFPLLGLFSVFLLLRGHNEPGGGFVGGLLMAGAFALHGLAHGPRSARDLLRVDPRTIVGAGLVVAVASGCVALSQRLPFMTGLWLSKPVPAVGKVGTVLLFDVGVYLVVMGTGLVILLTLAEE